MKTFTVNKIVYTAKPFTFNMICDLEDMGISMEAMANRPMSAVRGYLAICMGSDKDDAGVQMEQHLINGGNFEDVIEAMTEAMNESDFFQSLSKKQEKKTPTAKK